MHQFRVHGYVLRCCTIHAINPDDKPVCNYLFYLLIVKNDEIAVQNSIVKNVANYSKQGHFYVGYGDAGKLLLTDRKIT